MSELVEVGQLGRATFYRNFDTLEDVLHWRCEQVVDELFVYVFEYRRTNQLSTKFPLLKPLLRFFYLHSDIVELLIKAKRVDLLQTAIQERITRIQRVVIPKLDIDIADDYLEYGKVIRSSLIVSVLVHWIKEGKRQAPDELADKLTELSQKMSFE